MPLYAINQKFESGKIGDVKRDNTEKEKKEEHLIPDSDYPSEELYDAPYGHFECALEDNCAVI